jgi:hypothetical protein
MHNKPGLPSSGLSPYVEPEKGNEACRGRNEARERQWRSHLPHLSEYPTLFLHGTLSSHAITICLIFESSRHPLLLLPTLHLADESRSEWTTHSSPPVTVYGHPSVLLAVHSIRIRTVDYHGLLPEYPLQKPRTTRECGPGCLKMWILPWMISVRSEDRWLWSGLTTRRQRPPCRALTRSRPL